MVLSKEMQMRIDSNRKLIERKSRALKIVAALKKLLPKSKIALNFGDPWQLLVAVILSAQCTDKKVNEVTSALFKKYPNFATYLKARPSEFEQDIKPTGFYRNKTKSILRAAKVVKVKFGGKVPKTMEEILTIPGIGRKSANVILANAYGIIVGIAVDTHVIRLSQKLGLSKNKNPEKIEKDLLEVIPRKDWYDFNYRLIDYGRRYCPARPHDHAKCPLTKFSAKK